MITLDNLSDHVVIAPTPKTSSVPTGVHKGIVTFVNKRKGIMAITIAVEGITPFSLRTSLNVLPMGQEVAPGAVVEYQFASNSKLEDLKITNVQVTGNSKAWENFYFPEESAIMVAAGKLLSILQAEGLPIDADENSIIEKMVELGATPLATLKKITENGEFVSGIILSYTEDAKILQYFR